ncbi:hypothetical protein [Mucilaginibacter myungsuensis]|uniref:Uncharacterized protein n=1 Tax=Mucilaginibacter myungsuensis TaxID=649104 RepID=A0A929KS82_9SPHI|nr:hypothetical protein [Mucilaginibacter myungsuensis]MBE9660549.1 hypothetical protein [Mucilaginibacter myungsuensis]MDN3600594.1 hypothetical protein [Mucilaginibacter myungsuensis]
MGIILTIRSFIYVAFSSVLMLAQCRSSQATIPSPEVAAVDTVAITPMSVEVPVKPDAVPLKNMFGVNAFEWDFLSNPFDKNNRNDIYQTNMDIIRSFSGFRHYMDWQKIENTEGNYTFAPTNDGSWNYDVIYARCKADGITVLADLKNCPPWLMNTYPTEARDAENVPAPFGADLSKPASYIKQAQVAFQFAARYGSNAGVDRNLLKVDSKPRWNGDLINEVKAGLNLVKYIECDNERDKWWKGIATKQTAEEYAANMSAFYDGHKGKLGPNVGVKTADPNMKVVMGGIATCDTNLVKTMIEWCRKNRGTRSDGSVDLCFDVINYHYYANDGGINPHRQGTTGVAPELSQSGQVADAFVSLGKRYKLPVWVTESGYDINQGSWQRAIPIGSKSALLTQADWNLRQALLYMRHGIDMLYYYMLFDANPGNDPTQYATSGMAERGKRRPTTDYILQTNKLIGDYTYSKTINADPLVDVYVKGNKTMYVLTVPDQTGRTTDYELALDGASSANVYKLVAGDDAMDKSTPKFSGGKLKISVTETPVFVEGN